VREFWPLPVVDRSDDDFFFPDEATATRYR
jgi:hypothetical protein